MGIAFLKNFLLNARNSHRGRTSVKCIDQSLNEGHCGVAHTECMGWCSGEHTLEIEKTTAGAEEPEWEGAVHLSVVVCLPIHCGGKVFGCH